MGKNGKLHGVPGRARRVIAPAAQRPAAPPPKPQTVSEWRAGRRNMRTLPSGLQVELQKVTLLSLIAAGNIPQTLMADVEALHKHGLAKVGIAEFPKFAPAVDAVCIAAVRHPKIVAELSGPETDDVVLVTELDFEDRLMVFSWCNEQAVSLQPFPVVAAAAGVAPLQPGDGVERATEQSF